MGHETIVAPSPWMIIPFGLLLGAIALMPLVAHEWWERHYPKVSFGLGLITLVYYLFFLHAHERVLHTAHEYISFICLIGSLFIVASGIHVNVKGEATPFENIAFLFIGAVTANFIGTTGASMLLIRPWIRMNRHRIKPYHIVFFIFIVSNVGGCLTPVGDPPLFLGYLKGIPFWWVAEHCWQIWLTGVGLLLVIFGILDLNNYKKTPKYIKHVLEAPDVFRIQGLTNIIFLAIILGAVFIQRPPLLRELIMVTAALASYFTTPKHVHKANEFTFNPIREVVILFAGIFSTMMPALDYLQLHASKMGKPKIDFYFWGSGCLSAILDNAPTYLTFLSAEMGAAVPAETVEKIRHLLEEGNKSLQEVQQSQPQDIQNTLQALHRIDPRAFTTGKVSSDHIRIAYLIGNPHLNIFIVAVSIGAVFFGAATYIGNGPNFMVRSIAVHSKIQMPTFLGYIFRYTIPYLLPILVIVWIIFFK